MVLMYSFNPSKPRSKMACGVFATGNNFAVALLTPLSVAWSDKITAMSNSKGELYSNSVVGCGFWLLKSSGEFQFV